MLIQELRTDGEQSLVHKTESQASSDGSEADNHVPKLGGKGGTTVAREVLKWELQGHHSRFGTFWLGDKDVRIGRANSGTTFET